MGGVGNSHGIGLSFEETPAPTVKPAEGRVAIREGRVVTVGHAVLSVPGVTGVRLKDTYYVPPDGPDPLTHFPISMESEPIDAARRKYGRAELCLGAGEPHGPARALRARDQFVLLEGFRTLQHPRKERVHPWADAQGLSGDTERRGGEPNIFAHEDGVSEQPITCTEKSAWR
jgi:hypothetical protein